MADPVLFGLALELQSQGQDQKAAELYQLILTKDPQCGAAWHNLAVAQQKLELWDLAQTFFEQACILEPENAEFWHNRANCFRDQGQAAQAIPFYQHALALSPKDPDLLVNMGVTQMILDQTALAEVSFSQACAINPEHATGWNNLGAACRANHKLSDAEEATRKAIGLVPDYVDAHINLAQLLMLQCRYDEAWPHWRWRHLNPQSGLLALKTPRWCKDFAKGSRVLIQAEQGLGDNLQFSRFLPGLDALGYKVIIRCPDHLADFFQNWDIFSLNRQSQSVADHDCHLGLMDLPAALSWPMANLPPSLSWEKIRPASSIGKKKIGLVWAGSASHKNDFRRSIPSVLLSPILALSDFEFYSLQKDWRIGDAALFQEFPNLKDMRAQLTNLSDAAETIGALDLLISVDTAYLHLAGIVGTPSYGLISFDPDWRWGLGLSTSPWYPHLQLFRQKKAGDWGSAVQEVMAKLREF